MGAISASGSQQCDLEGADCPKCLKHWRNEVLSKSLSKVQNGLAFTNKLKHVYTAAQHPYWQIVSSLVQK